MRRLSLTNLLRYFLSAILHLKKRKKVWVKWPVDELQNPIVALSDGEMLFLKRGTNTKGYHFYYFLLSPHAVKRVFEGEYICGIVLNKKYFRAICSCTREGALRVYFNDTRSNTALSMVVGNLPYEHIFVKLFNLDYCFTSSEYFCEYGKSLTERTNIEYEYFKSKNIGDYENNK